MSSVTIQGNPSGTGIFTIASPNSNTNQTLTLPDSTGTLINTASTNVIVAAMLSTGAVGTGVGFVRDGSAGASSGSVILQLPNGTRVGICSGATTFNSANGIATITFPFSFSQVPNVTASVGRGSTLSGYLMSTQIGSVSTTQAQVLGNYTTGGSVLLLSSNEYCSWIAVGPV